jgi:O-glycosyl hydrolase
MRILQRCDPTRACASALLGLLAWSGTTQGQQVTEDQVLVIASSENGTLRLSELVPIPLGQGETESEVRIEIYPDRTRQTILGLGASLEHATCENLSKLSVEQREDVVGKLVDPTHGIGMNLMRVCIGTSDFVGEPYYSYDDMPQGETDPELTRFSIEKDRKYVVPTIQLALRKNPKLLIFASPWSPPAWMKDSGKLGTGSVMPECYPAYARYLLRFVQAYEAEGIPIHAITVQNEPQHTDSKYPTTRWSGAQQRDFIRDHLGPLFQQHQVKSEIWCWDHNWNLLDFPTTILSDPHAAQYVQGTAFHHYEGRVDAQSKLHAQFPNKPIYFTEGAVFRTRGAIRLTDILRHWSRSYNGWVIMLDEHRRPNRGPHSASATCIELLDDGSVRYNFDYYMMGQFMKYIQRDAVCVESTTPGPSTFRNVALTNPDGTKVLVVSNAGRDSQAFSVQVGSQSFRAELPAASVGTYLWK